MEARSTKQVRGPKKRNRCQKQLIWLSKKFPWVQHKYMQVKKTNIPTGSRKHTSKSPHIFCAPRSKKNNPGKSKKHVPVQKKGAQVQKTCIPKMVASPMQGMWIKFVMHLQLLGIPGLSKWFFKSVDEAVVPQKTFGVSESRMKVYTARWFEGNS